MLGDEHESADDVADADEDLESVIHGLAPILALGLRHGLFADGMFGLVAAALTLWHAKLPLGLLLTLHMLYNLYEAVKHIICSLCNFYGDHPMSRTAAGKEKKSFRLNMMFEPGELEELDNFRYSARIPSRSEAIRVLIKLGIEAFAAKAAKEGSAPSA